MKLYCSTVLVIASAIGLGGIAEPSKINAALETSPPQLTVLQTHSPNIIAVEMGNHAAILETPLMLGDEGATVVQLQEMLQRLGYYQEAIDGIFGEATQEAVLAFQAANNLTVDGDVGVATWEQLQQRQSPPPTSSTPSPASPSSPSPIAALTPPESPSNFSDFIAEGMGAIALIIMISGFLYLGWRYRKKASYFSPGSAAILAKIAKIPIAEMVGYFPLFSLLTVNAVAFIVYVQMRSTLITPELVRLQQVAAAKEKLLNQWFNQQREAILTASRSPELITNAKILLGTRQKNSPEYQAAYQKLVKYFANDTILTAGSTEISLLTNGGIVIFSTNKSREGQYQPLQNTTTYFTRETANRMVPNFYASPITGKLLITFATPLVENSSKRIGAVAVNLNLKDLDEKIREPINFTETQPIDLEPNRESYLVGRSSLEKNQFVSADPQHLEKFAAGVKSRGINQAMGGINESGLYLNYKKVPVIGVYRWIPSQNLALLAESSQSEIFRPARKMTRVIFGVGLATTVILSIIFIVAARTGNLQKIQENKKS